MNRPRVPEVVVFVASALLLGSLFLRWYDVPPAVDGVASTSGFGAMGVWISILLVAVSVLGLSLAATTLLRKSPSLPVALGVLTWVIGSLVWVVFTLRLLFEPALDAGLGSEATLTAAGYVAYFAATVIPTAALLSLRDERTDAPESRYTPPEPRPIPASPPSSD